SDCAEHVAFDDFIIGRHAHQGRSIISGYWRHVHIGCRSGGFGYNVGGLESGLRDSISRSLSSPVPFIALAALHQQGKQTDAVDGQDEKHRDFYAGTTFVLLFQKGTLREEWTLVVHIIWR